MRKNKNYKIVFSVLLITTILCGSTFSIMANTSQVKVNKDILEKTTDLIQGYDVLLDENFTDGSIPPSGDWGDWDHQQTNQEETWYIDSSSPHSEPYCGTVHRADTTAKQDEWLITPSIDFSGYSKIYLRFWWYTDYYVSAHVDYIDLNISISTDGGGNWTYLWSEDDLTSVFPTWEWIDTAMGDPIDLSTYAGETDVLIGFQYYSNDTSEAEYQELSIDDIVVYAPSVEPMECDAGGPYEWWWPTQYDFQPPGVRFHGSVTDAGPLGLEWLWDFGDGATSTLPYLPIHFYNRTGVFDVMLTVKDNTTDPPRIAFDQTTVNLFLIKPPDISITLQNISLGVKAFIHNVGEYNATYVNWTMTVSWGLRQSLEKIVANGTLEDIGAKTSEMVRSDLYFFAFGRIHIVISANPENIPGTIKHFSALKIGPFVIVRDSE